MNLTVEEQLAILQNINRYLAMQVSQLSLDNATLRAELDYIHIQMKQKQE